MAGEETILETDGAARGNPGSAGAGYIISREGKVLVQDKVHLGVTTNNVAEYTAMIMGLERTLRIGAKRVLALTDSLLVVRQIQGSYKVKKDHLKPLHRKCLDLISRLESFTIRYIPSSRNPAHRLAEDAASQGQGSTKPI